MDQVTRATTCKLRCFTYFKKLRRNLHVIPARAIISQPGHISQIALLDILSIYMIVSIHRFLHGISPDPLRMISTHPGPVQVGLPASACSSAE